MEKNQWSLTRITQENEPEFRDCIPARYGKWAFQKEKLLMGVKDSGEVPCGALAASMEEEIIQIDSIYVKPEFRRRGVGRKLIGSLQGVLAKTGKKELRAEYPYPKMRELELFFFTCGFRTEADGDEGNRIYTAPVGRIKDLKFLKENVPAGEGDLMSIQELPDQLRVQWLRRFGQDLPEELDPRNSGGRLLPEESLTYVRNGKVEAFTVVSHLEDDSVYLAAVYSSAGAVKALVPVLQETLRRVAKNYEDKTFCFAAATEAGRKLASHLCGGMEEVLDIQTMRTIVWRKEGEEEPVEYDPYDPVNVMPRLNGLGAVLERLEIEYDVLWSERDYPAILAAVDGRNLRFTYVPTGPVEEERFVLNVACAVAEDMGNPMEMVLLCQQFNLNSLFAMVSYLPAAGQAVMRCAVPEMGEIHGKESLQYLITLFLESISQFDEFLEEHQKETGHEQVAEGI